MIRHIRYPVLSTLFLCSMMLSGQNNAIVHFDKSFYVSGEVAWFNLFLPSSLKEKKVAIKVVVSQGETGKTNDFFIIKNPDRMVSGYYRIPFESKSGLYQFAFYLASGSELIERKLISASVPVYNDLEELEGVNLVDAPYSQESDIGSAQVRISLDTMPLQPRRKVKVEFLCEDESGNPMSGTLSLSVKDKMIAGPQIVGSPEYFLGTDIDRLDPNTVKTSIYVKGKVSDLDRNSLQVNVLGAYSGEENEIYYTRSDQEGDFLLELPDFSGITPIQFLGFQYEHPHLQTRLLSPESEMPTGEFIYTRGLLDYLTYSRMRKKIYQQYQGFEMILSGEPKKKPVAEWDPDVRYDLREYESFKDMKGFFGELMTPLKFNLNKDSTYTASLFNASGRVRSNTMLNGPPLFIVDDKVTRDADFIANMPTSYINEVELFVDAPKLRDYFKAMGASGVVRIKTSLDDVKVPDADEQNLYLISGLQNAEIFPAFDFDADSDPHRPFFRPQIYWNPSVIIDEDGRGSISFFHSDDTGSFVLKALFQSDDGVRGQAEYEYEVVLH